MKNEGVISLAKGDKYSLLLNHLRASGDEIIVLSFSQVEQIVGFNLPESAYTYPPWWANDVTHSQAIAWLDAGYYSQADIASEKVIFRKG